MAAQRQRRAQRSPLIWGLAAPRCAIGGQAGDRHRAVHAAGLPDPEVFCGQPGQARPLGQGHHRDQARLRHEMRVIKRRVHLRELMQQLHLRGALSSSTTGSVSNSHRPSSEGTFRVDTPEWRPIYTVRLG